MEEIKQKLSELEAQVSAIKDPALRKVAFEKLLEYSFTAPSVKKPQSNAKIRQERMRKKKNATNIYYSDSQIRQEIKNMNVTGALKGFPNFKACGSKINGYMWVLAYGKCQKVDGMNIHEIAYILSKKLFKQTKYSTVYGIHKKVKEGWVIKDPGTDNWRITPDGEDYLKNLNKMEN